MNVAHLLQQAADLQPQQQALIFGDTCWRYAQLQTAVNRVASWLQQRGINQGDRVALYLPNIPEFAIAYYAILRCGAVAVSLNAMLTAREARYILRDSGAVAVFTTADTSANVQVEPIEIIVAEGESGQHIALTEILSSGSPVQEIVECSNNDPAAILYTSGTTGYPKGAVLSHHNILSNVEQVVRCTSIGASDKAMLFLPLFHCFGQNFILNGAIAAQASIVMHRRFEPESILDSIQQHNITYFYAVPTVFIALLNHPAAQQALAGVRYFFTAAAAIPAEIAGRWHDRFGSPIWEGYGLTETAPFASYNHATHYKPGSIGTPIDDVAMKIVRDDGSTADPGEWGEIAIKGPNVMLGYWNQPQETSKVIRNGWFHTGDIGIRASDGYFEIRDRKNDMINSSGYNIYPAEIENELYRHPAIAEVAVFGLPHAEKGEIVAAAVVLHDSSTVVDQPQIARWARETLAAYKIPRACYIVPSLPKNPTGKILKRVLREQYSDPAGTPEATT